jgi:uncharacterized membrane protein
MSRTRPLWRLLRGPGSTVRRQHRHVHRRQGFDLLVVAAQLEPLENRVLLTASFQGIGVLGQADGVGESTAAAVSANGNVVVGTNYGGSAIEWTAATGIIALPQFGIESVATGVSADGSVIVGWGKPTGLLSNYSQALVWQGGNPPIALPSSLPGVDLIDAAAAAVSANGNVVVGSDLAANSGLPSQGFEWSQATGLVGFSGSLVVGAPPQNLANAVSGDGSVVVGSAPQTIAGQLIQSSPAMWTNSVTPATLSGVGGEALGVSNNGSFIVGADINSADVWSGFLWNPASASVVTLGAGYPVGVSNDGSIMVGSTFQSPSSAGEALVWLGSTTPQSLQTVLTDEYGLGSALTGWTLNAATAITADGNTIVGDGIDPQGGQEGWIVQLNAPTTPSPVLNVPPAVSVNENSSVTFAGNNAISVSDTAGNGNNNEQVTLSVNDGTLTLVPTSGSLVGSSGTMNLTISGTLSEVNADLLNLVYTPTAGVSGPDTLTVTPVDTTDQTQGSQAQVSITVNPLPMLTVPAAVSVNENSSVGFSGRNAISVTDTAGAGNDNEQLTLTVKNGTLTLLPTAGTQVSGSGTMNLAISGTLSEVNSDLLNLLYTPTTGSTSSNMLTVTVLDTSDQALGSPAQVTITINSPPVITAPSSVSVDQNAVLPFAGANTISVADPSGTAESFTLSVSHGTLSLGATAGLTVTGNGSRNLALSGTLSTLNADLPTLAYAPNHGYKATDTLTLSDTDTSDSLTGTASVAIAVIAVKKPKQKHPPTIKAPSAVSVNENASLIFSTANGNSVTLTDSAATASSDSLALTVAHGKLTLGSTTGLTFAAGSNASASMTVKGTLANLNAALNGLEFTPTIGYSGSASLAIKVTDSGDNLTGSATVAITVVVPPSQPTVTVGTPVTTSVPGEPVPLVIEATDTYAPAEAAPFTFTISFGDGSSTRTSSASPLLTNHVYKSSGTFTVTVVATDEFAHTSAAATETISVVPVAVETNPFNTSETALFVGTSGKSTIGFAASGQNIAVTLNGVAEGTFGTSGPLIVFGQGGKDNYTEGPGVTNTVDLLESATADNVEADLDNEAFQWAGLTAAVDILNG